MRYSEAVQVADKHLNPVIADLYNLSAFNFRLIDSHEGGRNLVYVCENDDNDAKIIRISFLNDRRKEDFLAETEYISHLFKNGGSVANVICSVKGNLVETIKYNEHSFFVCVFQKARGIMLADNNYKYRDGVPISEYFYSCGKTLGKIHSISKEYCPVHHRYSFFDKYNEEYIMKIVPESLSLLKQKFVELINVLKDLNKNQDSYGMIHFDFNDGNYHIDFDDGRITVFDFDNSCFGFYMYDLAELWKNGFGWAVFEPDPNKRKMFMDEYFKTVIEGYRSETALDDTLLNQLSVFVQATLMEHIIDDFQCMQDNGEEPNIDEDLAYRIKCMEEDIPFIGFFHEIYSYKTPFELEI